jgi:general secretion pathway protein N
MRHRLQWVRTALLVVMFGAVFALSAVAMAPARWMSTALEHATDGRVRLAGATGFPWRGHGDLVVRVGGGEIVLPGTNWHWLPSRLAVGELALELKFDGATATGGAVIARRVESFVVRDANVALSAAALADGIDMLRGWRPSGTLNFRTQGLALKERSIAGDAELTWQGAATATAPLGDYRAVVHAEGSGDAHLELATLKGPLHLAASGDFGSAQGLRLRGTATPEAAHRVQLLPLLGLIGTDRGDGVVAFDIAFRPRGSA